MYVGRRQLVISLLMTASLTQMSVRQRAVTVVVALATFPRRVAPRGA
jgi:hypothetical protein